MSSIWSVKPDAMDEHSALSYSCGSRYEERQPVDAKRFWESTHALLALSGFMQVSEPYYWKRAISRLCRSSQQFSRESSYSPYRKALFLASHKTTSEPSGTLAHDVLDKTGRTAMTPTLAFLFEVFITNLHIEQVERQSHEQESITNEFNSQSSDTLIKFIHYLESIVSSYEEQSTHTRLDELLREAYSVLVNLLEEKSQLSVEEYLALIYTRRFALKQKYIGWETKIKAVIRQHLLDKRIPGCLPTTSQAIPEHREHTLSWEEAEHQFRTYIDEVRTTLSAYIQDRNKLELWVDELKRDFITELEVSLGLPSSLR